MKRMMGKVLPPDKVIFKEGVKPEGFCPLEELEREIRTSVNYFGVAVVVIRHKTQEDLENDEI